MAQIAKTFREMAKDLKPQEDIKATNLNHKVCEALGVPTSKKIFKDFLFKNFTEAIEAARSQFRTKIEIVQDSIKLI